MWKTVKEAEAFADNVLLYFRDLIKRKIALQDDTPVEEIEIETEYGMCKVGIDGIAIPVADMDYGRAGQYSPNDDISLSNLFNYTDSLGHIYIEVKLSTLLEYNDVVVVPYYCSYLTVINDVNTKIENTNLSLVLQSPSTYLKNSITYLNKLIIKPNESADFSLNPYSGMHIDYVYVKNDMCRFINCVIGKLVTNRVTLNLNFTNSYINSIDVVDVLDFELVEDMIGISYFSALLSTLRTLQNKPSEFLTKDSVTIYLSDVHDESGYFIYFEALVEDYLEIISEYFRVSINSLNVDVKKKKVQFTHASGVKVNVYLSNLSKSEIESRLTHIEMRNYE